MTYWRTENIIKASTDSTNPETISRKPPEKKSKKKKKSCLGSFHAKREAWEMLYNVIMTNVSVSLNRHKELPQIRLIGDDRCLLYMLTVGEAS